MADPRSDFQLVVNVEQTASTENFRKFAETALKIMESELANVKINIDPKSIDAIKNKLEQYVIDLKNILQQVINLPNNPGNGGGGGGGGGGNGGKNSFASEQKIINDYYAALKKVETTQNDVFLNTNNKFESKSGVWKYLADGANKAKTAFDAVNQKLKQNKQWTDAVETAQNKLNQAVEKYRNKTIDTYVNKVQSVFSSNNSITRNQQTGLYESTDLKDTATVQTLNAQKQAFDSLRNSVSAANLTLQQKQDILKQLQAAEKEVNTAISERDHRQKDLNTTDKESAEVMKRSLSLLEEVDGKLKKDWSQVHNSSSQDTQKALKLLNDAKIEAQNKLDIFRNNPTPENAKALEDATNNLSKAYQNLGAEAEKSGDKQQSFATKLQGFGKTIASYFSAVRIMSRVISTVKQMVKTSIELDTAMTQLQIVTKASNSEMGKFGDTAVEVAKKTATSVKDIINSSTTYARLGYDLEDSAKLAEYTAMLTKVGDIDTKDAQDAMTAMVKAFGKDIKDIGTMMDELVETGNNFPISVSQIAEGMNNASSALAAAGNTYEQSIALLTAANTTVQNAAKSSTGLRTIAARLRNTTTELNDLGEDMSESKYEDVVKALTDAKVKLTDLNGEYRSTYDIMKDIAEQWGSMSSKQQAALATQIAGTRQQNVFFSIIEQFQEASDAMERMSSSAGALDEAYDIYLGSAQAKIDQFKATWEDLSQRLIQTDVLGGLSKFGSAIANVLVFIIKLLNHVGGLKTGLIALGSAFAVVKAVAIENKFQALLKYFTDLPEAMGAVIKSLFTTKAATDAVGDAALLTQAKFAVAFAAIAVVVGAIILAYKSYEKAIETTDELSEKLEDLASDYEEVGREIEANENKIESLKARKDEINKEPLTLVNSEELKNLDSEIEKLKEINNQLKIKQKREQEKSVYSANELRKSMEYPSRSLKDTTYYKSLRYGTVTSATGFGEHYKHSTIRGIRDDRAISEVEAYDTAIENYVKLSKELKEEPERAEVLNSKLENTKKILDTISEHWQQIAKYSNNKEYVKEANLQLLKYNYLLGDSTTKAKSLTDIFEIFTGVDVSDKTLSLDEMREVLTKLSEEDAKKLSLVLTDIGYSSEATGVAILDLAEDVNLAKAAIDKENKAVEEDQKSLKNLTTALGGLSKNLGTIADLKAEWNKNGFVSAETLDGLDDSIKNLSSFGKFASVLGDASSSTKQVEQATRDLVTEYINSSTALDNVTDKTKKYVTQQLKSMGVTNASQIVAAKLLESKLEEIGATGEFTASTKAEVEALLKEAGVATTAKEALYALTYAELAASEGGIDTTKEVEQLLQLGKAAGISAQKLQALETLRKDFEKLREIELKLGGRERYPNSEIQKSLEKEKEDIQKSIEEQQKILNENPLTIPVETDPKGIIDLAQVARDELAKVKNDIELGKKSLKDYYNELGKQIKNLQAQQNAKPEYKDTIIELQKERNEVYIQIQEEFLRDKKALLDKDKITEEEYYRAVSKVRDKLYGRTDKASVDKVKELDQELYDHYKQAAQNMLDLTKDMLKQELNDRKEALEQQKDLVAEQVDAQIDALEKEKEAYEETIEAEIKSIDKRISSLQKSADSQKDALDRELKAYEDSASARKKALEKEMDIFEDTIKDEKKALEKEQKAFEKSIDIEKEALKKKKDELKDYTDKEKKLAEERYKAIEKETEEKIKALKEELDTYKKLADAKKKALQDAATEEDFNDNLAQKQHSLNLLLQEQTSLKNDTSGYATKRKAEIEDEINALEEEIRKYQRDRNITLATEAIDKDVSSYEEGINGKIEELEAQQEASKNQYDLEIEKIEEYAKVQEEMYESQIEMLEETLEARKEAYELEIEQLEETLEARKRVHEAQIEQIEAEVEAQRNAYEERKRQIDEILETQVAALEAQKEMLEQQKEAQVKNFEAQKEALEDYKKARQKQLDTEIKAVEKNLQSEGELTKRALEKMSNMNEAFYKELVEYNRQYGTGIETDITNKWYAATVALQAYSSILEAMTKIKGAKVKIDYEVPVPKMASGTKNLPRSGVYQTDENGYELKLNRRADGNYEFLNSGSVILPNNVTKKLMGFLANPDNYIARVFGKSSVGAGSALQENITYLNSSNPVEMNNTYNIYGSSPEETASQIEKVTKNLIEKTFEKVNRNLNINGMGRKASQMI